MDEFSEEEYEKVEHELGGEADDEADEGEDDETYEDERKDRLIEEMALMIQTLEVSHAFLVHPASLTPSRNRSQSRTPEDLVSKHRVPLQVLHSKVMQRHHTTQLNRSLRSYPTKPSSLIQRHPHRPIQLDQRDARLREWTSWKRCVRCGKSIGKSLQKPH
jgi:hypothetical protein